MWPRNVSGPGSAGCSILRRCSGVPWGRRWRGPFTDRLAGQTYMLGPARVDGEHSSTGIPGESMPGRDDSGGSGGVNRREFFSRSAALSVAGGATLFGGLVATASAQGPGAAIGFARVRPAARPRPPAS
jgi:hypothetical protein